MDFNTYTVKITVVDNGADLGIYIVQARSEAEAQLRATGEMHHARDRGEVTGFFSGCTLAHEFGV